MPASFRLKTFSRRKSAGVLGEVALAIWDTLEGEVPLILDPEPKNRKDPAAVLLRLATGDPCGYVAREHAPVVRSALEAGKVLLAKTTGSRVGSRMLVLIWEEEAREVEREMFNAKPRETKKPNRYLVPELEAWGSNR